MKHTAQEYECFALAHLEQNANMTNYEAECNVRLAQVYATLAEVAATEAQTAMIRSVNDDLREQMARCAR
jgi:hypothetical protein